MTRTNRILSLALTLLALSAAKSRADEGMWPFQHVPSQDIKDKYGFTPTQEWLDHLRLSSVRVAGSGSGSFVSPEGLVMTNQHIARHCLQALSTSTKNYVADGFFARTREEEVRCPNIELHVLISMENITAKVVAAVKPGATDAEASVQRKAEAAKIEKEASSDKNLTQVVELFSGGEYWLYRYNKHNDVRVVMVPEERAAYFGGDSDNFNFPRHELDMAFLRVYEEGKAFHPVNYLAWSEGGVKEGDLVFVSGHPGFTSRIRSMAQLEFERDLSLETLCDGLKGCRKVLGDYAALGTKEAVEVQSDIVYRDNAIKVYNGLGEALRDPKVWARKAAEEKAVRDAIAADPALKAEYGQVWDDLAAVKKLDASRFKERIYRNLPLPSKAFVAPLTIAASGMARYADEMARPEADRAPEYRDAGAEAVKKGLLAPLSFSPGLEERMVALSLSLAKKALGENDPFVKDALGGRKPEEVAHDAVSASKLSDPEFRKQLVDGGPAAIAASDDPLLVLARKLEPYSREAQVWYKKNVVPVEDAATAKLARAWLAVRGASAYPDANFTLRLSYGKVAGYEEHTQEIPFQTTLHGLFDRSFGFGQRKPYELSQRFLDHKGDLDLSTPLNFVTTNDIIGGNSGSPMVNKNGQVVGLVFDGNIHSLGGRFLYAGDKNRTIAVHSAGMLEVLRKVYGMPLLAEELAGRVARKIVKGDEQPIPAGPNDCR